LDIWTNGVVTISNLSANWNGGDGAYIDAYNEFIYPGGIVTLTGSNTFIGNGDGVTDARGALGSGLVVISDSTITISNLTASENTQDGAYLQASNGGFWGLAKITLTGVNTFESNGLTGLYFLSPQNASVTKITADSNGEDGVYGEAEGKITLTCGSMTNNTGYGWSLSSLSTVTLQGIFAYGNGTNTNPVSGTFVYVRTCPLP
jgi:parallel beta-helix repeat protein